jgi:hypothetical protein
LAEKNFKVRNGLIVSNNIGVNTESPSVSLDLRTTDAILVPSGNTGQRPTGANGYFRYNNQTNNFEGYANGAWSNVGGLSANVLSSNGTSTNNAIVVWDGTTGNTARNSLASISNTGKITGIASNTTNAPLNLPHGSAPSSPVNGDIWTTNADLAVRINGTTYTYLPKEGGFLTGRLSSSAGVITGNNTMAISNSSLGELEVRNNSNGAAMMAFHRQTDHAVYFGLDTDNVLKVGGWSMGNNAYKIWHQGNDGAGSGLDADLLDGFNQSETASSNTIVKRNATGHVYANYFNTTADDISTGTPSHVAVQTSSDSFIRWQTLNNFKNSLGFDKIPAAGTISITWGSGTGFTLHSSDFSGAVVTNPFTTVLRFTFSTVLPDTRYIVNIDHDTTTFRLTRSTFATDYFDLTSVTPAGPFGPHTFSISVIKLW